MLTKETEGCHALDRARFRHQHASETGCRGLLDRDGQTPPVRLRPPYLAEPGQAWPRPPSSGASVFQPLPCGPFLRLHHLLFRCGDPCHVCRATAAAPYLRAEKDQAVVRGDVPRISDLLPRAIQDVSHGTDRPDNPAWEDARDGRHRRTQPQISVSGVPRGIWRADLRLFGGCRIQPRVGDVVRACRSRGPRLLLSPRTSRERPYDGAGLWAGRARSRREAAPPVSLLPCRGTV